MSKEFLATGCGSRFLATEPADSCRHHIGSFNEDLRISYRCKTGEMDTSGTSLKPNGETVAISPRESTISDLGATSALQDALAVERGGGGGGRRERGYKTRREKEEEEKEEEESTISDSSSEVDEHRLLSVNCGSNMSTTSAQEQATRVKLTQDEESWSDEDIDPFSFYPPLTKWDYLKVSEHGALL